jgi:hypothetical protein
MELTGTVVSLVQLDSRTRKVLDPEPQLSMESVVDNNPTSEEMLLSGLVVSVLLSMNIGSMRVLLGHQPRTDQALDLATSVLVRLIIEERKATTNPHHDSATHTTIITPHLASLATKV